MKKYDIIIIGAGVIGAFIARELSKYQLDVLVLDKENDVGNVTSMANSAIIHSGYDPKPNSLKAKLNVLGNKMFDQIAKELDVNFARVGSLTIATEESQIPLLESLNERAKINGVVTELLTKEEVIKIEPNITSEVKMALFAKDAGIIDPFNLVAHAFENALDNGVELLLGKYVVDIQYKNSSFFVYTKDNEIYESSYVVNAAGLGSEKIAKIIGDIDWTITPRKGEYFVLDHYAPGLVNHTIFPLPSSKGKGILVTMTTSGNYLVGPSSEYTFEDDFSTDKLTLDNVKKQAQELIPNIPFNQVVRVFSGLRSTSSRGDFIIETDTKNEWFLNLGGIESPGLVSAPAIALYVIDNFIKDKFNLIKKDNYNPYIRKYLKPKTMLEEERNNLIKSNPDYGEMVCYCEQVTLGEIKDAMSRSVPLKTVKAIKKRLRPGFGKCQGGFCQPRIVLEIAKFYNIPLSDVLYDKEGSNILKENVKK